jgi:putative ABC transport system ATP-binding protein
MEAPLIQLEEVKKTYRTGEVQVEALRGISMNVKRGDFLAIMGASGTGKSTLMNILGCLDRPTSGRYLMSGQEVSLLGRDGLAEVRNRTIGFVFQNFNLLHRTSALENVELPLLYAGLPSPRRRELAVKALERVGLGDRMAHTPSQLSGGQQQRVAIARALVLDPRLILADEPTGNLDSQTSAEIVAVFKELVRAGITMVLVTHEPEMAAHASRVVVLREGRITSDRRQGAPADSPAGGALAEARS